MYYRSAASVLVVFDVTRTESFSAVDFWVNEVRSKTGCDVLMVVVANKVDCENRLVSKEQGETYCKSNGAHYFECSALTGMGVQQIFEFVGQ